MFAVFAYDFEPLHKIQNHPQSGHLQHLFTIHFCHLVPFDGSLDFDRIARQIRESGYSGSLLLELLPEKTPAYQPMNPIEYFEHAAHAAKRLRDMVDVK